MHPLEFCPRPRKCGANPQALHGEAAKVRTRHRPAWTVASALWPLDNIHTTTASMSEDKETLISMGFAPERADWALRVKKGQGVQAAMDFLLAHADDPIPDPEDENEEDCE